MSIKFKYYQRSVSIASSIYLNMKKQGQLAAQIKKLQYQLSYSEHINKQLSAQLSAMCCKLGLTPSKFKQNSDLLIINTTVHLQELYYLEPLLMCYEETIHLLKLELDEAKEQAKVIQDNVENIVNENGFLRKELQAKIELLGKADNLGFNAKFLQIEERDLKDKIALLNSKNQYMMRKNKELTEECEKLREQNLSLFDHKQLEKLELTAKESTKLKQTELIKMETEVQVLKNKLQNQQNMNAEWVRKIADLENDIIKLKNEVRVTKQQLDNTTGIHDRLKENLQNEVINLKDQLSVSLKKEQQMFTKNMAIESELQDKNNRIHNVSVQNSQLQSNNNNMLQMLESYEVKVSGLTKKIKKLEAEIKDFNEQRADYTKRAEISEWKLSEKNEEMERKESEWRKQKARLSKMWEDRLETMKKSFEAPINKA